ncbi:MAG: hypothetical protein ABIN91_21635 [Mucilaginibacter sp.]|uniref:hypothetical protein n=1 Tax=Mucilaginibacter sp. TaxID=1882438 RepID=UPI003265E1D9
MEKLRRLLRLSGIVMFVALASFGIGIFGAVPIPPKKRKEDHIEFCIELKEAEKEGTDTVMFEVKP